MNIFNVARRSVLSDLPLLNIPHRSSLRLMVALVIVTLTWTRIRRRRLAMVAASSKTNTPRVALVTGATSGIGRAITAALRGRGTSVVPAARPSDRLDAAADGGASVACDLATDNGLDALRAAMMDFQERIQQFEEDYNGMSRGHPLM